MGGPKSHKRDTSQHPTSFQSTFGEKFLTETYGRKAASFLQKQPDEFFTEAGKEAASP
jgi:hypothetical protein